MTDTGFMGGFGPAPFTVSTVVPAPAPAPSPNLGLGTTWGVDPEEEWRRYLLRFHPGRTAGGDLGAYNAPETPLPLPPPAPPGQGRPPAASGAAGAATPAADPYGPPTPSPEDIRAGKLANRTGWQQAGDWFARNFGGGAGGQNGMQTMAAVGGAGARMMAPPPQPEMRLSPQPVPTNRPQAAPFPVRPGAMDLRRRRMMAPQRRGILDV